MPSRKRMTYYEQMSAQFWYQVGAALMALYLMVEALMGGK